MRNMILMLCLSLVMLSGMFYYNVGSVVAAASKTTNTAQSKAVTANQDTTSESSDSGSSASFGPLTEQFMLDVITKTDFLSKFLIIIMIIVIANSVLSGFMFNIFRSQNKALVSTIQTAAEVEQFGETVKQQITLYAKDVESIINKIETHFSSQTSDTQEVRTLLNKLAENVKTLSTLYAALNDLPVNVDIVSVDNQPIKLPKRNKKKPNTPEPDEDINWFVR